MASTLIFVSLFCVVAVLVYMARYSGRVRVTQSRLIHAPIEQVFAKVVDFQQWGAWNPWLAHEPGAELTVSGTRGKPGSECAWDSDKAGTGVVRLVRSVTLKSIEQRMQLKQPFVVRGRSQWTFTERDGMTEVAWQIKARVAFTMRAFSQTVRGALELDSRYGLDRLASLLEPADAPRYQLSVLGPQEVPACRYVYQTYQGPIKELPLSMRACFSELHSQLAALGISPVGAPLAFYTRTNIKLRTTTCLIGLPVGDAQVGDMPVRNMPSQRVFRVVLQGDHSALELAWYLAMQRMTQDKLKPDQRSPPFETHVFNASTAPSNDWITEVNVPMLS
jgi:hypothetical protein